MPAERPVTYGDEEILDALHWCRLGRVRPERDGAFHEAKRRGLLAQDPVWRTTIKGELMLARRRPEAYGRRPMGIECPQCHAEPGDPCSPFSPRHKYQLTHAARDRRAAAPAPEFDVREVAPHAR
jgi:hypothetical protein